MQNYQVTHSEYIGNGNYQRSETTIQATSLTDAKRKSSLWKPTKGKWHECSDGTEHVKITGHPHVIIFKDRLWVNPVESEPYRMRCSLDKCENCGSRRNHRSVMQYETRDGNDVLIRCSDCHKEKANDESNRQDSERR